MEKTLFRADSGSQIGLGHIKRDLVYAKEFESVSFACLNLAGNIISQIPYRVFVLQSNSLDELVNLIKTQNFTQIVIDNYEIDAKFEQELKTQTGIKIISFDDEKKPHFCDKLISPSISVKKEDYLNLVPPNCEIQTGKILVRDEFYEEAKIKRDKIFDHFICIGGTDIKNFIPQIIKKLPPSSKIAVATTSANPNLDKLKNLPNINIFVDNPNLAKIMNESKFLHISASSLINEARVLGAKFALYRVADNQTDLFNYLKKQGFQSYDLL